MVRFRDAVALLRIAVLVPVLGSSGPTGAQEQNNPNLRFTGCSAELAIDGDGYFVARAPKSDACYLRRRGDCCLDEYGNFIWDDGSRLQGYVGTNHQAVGDLSLTPTYPFGQVVSYSVRANGEIWTVTEDAVEHLAGQILLQTCGHPENLVRLSSGVYKASPAASPRPLTVPGTNGVGSIRSEWLDMTPEPVRLSLAPAQAPTSPLEPGVLTQTGLPTDLGIVGPGCFLVRHTNTAELFATRAGLFLNDGAGYLITYDGLRLQGCTNAATSEIGDVRIAKNKDPGVWNPDAVSTHFRICTDGKIMALSPDGTEFLSGQVLIFTFDHPELLNPTSLGCYAGVTLAGPRKVVLTEGLYDEGIRWGQLELRHATKELLAIRHTWNLRSQGCIEFTNSPTALAINGNGYFALRDPTTGQQFVTRTGAFHLDAAGHLITESGLRVQGYCDASLSTRGDLKVDGTDRPAPADPSATVAGFCLTCDGAIHIILSDGFDYVRGQVLLQEFMEPFRLVANEDGIYTNMAVAGPLPLLLVPGTSGLGRIYGSALEIPEVPVPLMLPAQSGMLLRITGEPDRRWTIQASADLCDWTSLGEAASTPGETEFSDPAAATLPVRFYRVLVSDL